MLQNLPNVLIAPPQAPWGCLLSNSILLYSSISLNPISGGILAILYTKM